MLCENVFVAIDDDRSSLKFVEESVNETVVKLIVQSVAACRPLTAYECDSADEFVEDRSLSNGNLQSVAAWNEMTESTFEEEDVVLWTKQSVAAWNVMTELTRIVVMIELTCDNNVDVIGEMIDGRAGV